MPDRIVDAWSYLAFISLCTGIFIGSFVSALLLWTGPFFLVFRMIPIVVTLTVCGLLAAARRLRGALSKPKT
jgi:hypothetical protein